MTRTIPRRASLAAACWAGMAAPGCRQDNPNATDPMEIPTITKDAPRSSEEAALRAEPSPPDAKHRPHH